MCWRQNIAIIILDKRIEPMENFMERLIARSTQDDDLEAWLKLALAR